MEGKYRENMCVCVFVKWPHKDFPWENLYAPKKSSGAGNWPPSHSKVSGDGHLRVFGWEMQCTLVNWRTY
jgi:hypothetical protein